MLKSTDSLHETDVLVMGSGPAGLATAIELAKRGVDVTVADHARFPRPKSCGDVLSDRALSLLEGLGVSNLLLDRYESLKGIRFCGPDRAIARCSQPFGRVVPREDLDYLLRRRANFEGATLADEFHILPPTALTDGRLTIPARHRVEKQTISTRYLVIASGGTGRLPEKMGFSPHFQRLLFGIRAYWEGVKDLSLDQEIFFPKSGLRGFAWITPLDTHELVRFRNKGQSGRANVGLLLDANDYAQRQQSLAALYRSFLTKDKRLAARFEGAEADIIRGFPIRAGLRQGPLASGSVFLVGDAAGAANPLSGEGVAHALKTGVLAAQAIADILAEKLPATQAIARYDREVRESLSRDFATSEETARLLSEPLLLEKLIAKASKNKGLAMRLSSQFYHPKEKPPGKPFKSWMLRWLP